MTIALLVILVVVAVLATLKTMSRGKGSRKKNAVGGFGWVLLFLGSGRMPPPPPQSQIEEEAGTRKNRGIRRDDPS